MIRPLISAFVAASIGLASLAPTPALAGNDDLKRLLGGVATIVILGAAYDHLRDKREQDRRVVTPQPTRHAKIVPAQCLRQFETRRGTQRMFVQRCLNRNMRNANRLPQACAIQVRTERGPRYGYAPRCLRDYGWRRG